MRKEADSTASAEEADLLARAGRGDREAFRRLYARYSQPLFSFAVRLVGSTSAAEELTQDAFVKLWKSAASFDASRSRPFTWAVTIVRRTCIDYLRRRRNLAPTVPFDSSVETNAADGGATDAREEAEKREDADRVRGALGALPEKQREALELALFSELTHAEIASHLDQPVGTVKSWIRRGMLELRMNLADTNP